MRALDLVTVPAHPLLHAEGRVGRAHRVVLVGERRAEEGHDPVSHDLVDGALVVVNGLHHALEHRVEQSPRLLGVAVGEQLHRALQIREQDGHLLALALERAAGGEDARGEVPRGVRLGSDARCCGRRRQGLTALVAEVAAGSIGVAAGRAGSLELRPAAAAELGPGWVRVAAVRAGHRERASPGAATPLRSPR